MSARSTNCHAEGKKVSLLAHGRYEHPDPACRIDLPEMFSCQTSGFEAPDKQTRKAMKDLVRDELEAKGCEFDNTYFTFGTNFIGADRREYSAKKLREGYASNCYKFGNSINSATHMARAQCTVQGVFDHRGQPVKNTNMVFSAELAVCDINDESENQLHDDLKDLVVANAKENRGITIGDVDDLACSISFLPMG